MRYILHFNKRTYHTYQRNGNHTHLNSVTTPPPLPLIIELRSARFPPFVIDNWLPRALPTVLKASSRLLQDFKMEEVEEWNELIEAWYNSSQRRNVVIVARSTAIFTLLGSTYIIQDIVKDATRRTSTKNRIIFLMSIFDFLFSFFGAVLGTSMAPQDIGVPGAAGNTMTCTLQGFIASVSVVASAYFNLSLALCYLLMVRFEYSDETLRNLEPYFLSLPLIVSLLPSCAGLFFQMYNFNGVNYCFARASPYRCQEEESPFNCTRGGSSKYWYLFNSILVYISACVIIMSMVMMYRAILDRERSNDQYRFSTTSTTVNVVSNNNRPFLRRNLSNTMRSQGLWYSGAFLVSFFPISVYYTFFFDPYWLLIIVSLTANMVGFFNAVIYVRPRFVKFRRDNSHIGFISSVWYTLLRTSPPGGVGNRKTRSSIGREMVQSSSDSLTRIPLNEHFSRLFSRLKGFVVQKDFAGAKDRELEEAGEENNDIMLPRDDEEDHNNPFQHSQKRRHIIDGSATETTSYLEPLNDTYNVMDKDHDDIDSKEEASKVKTCDLLIHEDHDELVAPEDVAHFDVGSKPEEANIPDNQRGGNDVHVRNNEHVRNNGQRRLRRGSTRVNRRPSSVEISLEEWGIIFEDDTSEG